MSLRGELVVITQEEEKTPHLIKAVRGQWRAKVHHSPLANFTLDALFKFSLHVAPNCIQGLIAAGLSVFKSSDHQIHALGAVFLH